MKTIAKNVTTETGTEVDILKAKSIWTVRTLSSSMPAGFLITETSYSNTDRPVNAATGHVAQENHYYPGGLLFGERTVLFF